MIIFSYAIWVDMSHSSTPVPGFFDKKISDWGLSSSAPSGPAWHWTITDFGSGYQEVLGVWVDDERLGATKKCQETFSSPETYDEFIEFLDREEKLNKQKNKKLTFEEQQLHQHRSILRTKKLVRQKAIMLKADRMVTCTTRAPIVDSEQFREITTRFFRLCRSSLKDFQYIAVFERHISDRTSPKKFGSLHLHIAISGYVDYNLVRRLWRESVQHIFGGDDFEGANINVTPPDMRRNKASQSRAIAGYMAKYLTKDADNEYVKGKKRYWSSRNIPKPVKTKLYTVPSVLKNTYKEIFSDVLGKPIKKVFNPARKGASPPIFWLST